MIAYIFQTYPENFHIRGHPLHTYAKFSEELTFLPLWRIRRLEILHMYLMDDSFQLFIILLKLSRQICYFLRK